MPLDWSPFVAFVAQHQRFLLTTHVRPDGDALGSLLALAEGLRARGKSTATVVASDVPARYEFLDPERRIERFVLPGDHWAGADAVIVVDTGTWGQLSDFGPFLKTFGGDKVVIDHHVTQDELGARRFVDTTAEANGRLIVEALDALGVPLTASMAIALFTAVSMDTGWFKHGNTSAKTFELIARLTRDGANPETLNQFLNQNNSLGRIRLQGLAMDRLQTEFDGRAAWSAIHRDDYAKTGALPQDSEELVNITLSVAGVQIGLFFMEQPRGGVKVSFRSRARYDVGWLAEQFGGGGHRQASGAIFDATLPEARARVLPAVGRLLAASS